MKNIHSQKTEVRLQSTSWLPENRPLIIAGPCAAETRQQVLESAHELSLQGNVDYLRAGVWKPRTKPGTFQGVGAPALEWMREARELTGLKIATEVGSPTHVEEAMKAGTDLLWIGARTVSNPFVMQDIADALQGTQIPVLVKNPLSPDLDLWQGAIIRLVKANIANVGAIHRGFFWWGKSQFRNQPFWHIPVELKNRMPEIPIICDPSHIAGKRSLIPLLVERALEKEFAGLMIEVHPRPDEAWSDASQQLTPQAFQNLIQTHPQLLLQNNAQELLQELRAEVDIMDDMLVWALSSRMELAEKIAGIKQDNHLQTLQSTRWEEVMERVKDSASQNGLRHSFIETLFNCIHSESLSLQNSLLNNKEKAQKKHKFAV